MYLKKLELYGFKSFADKVCIDFNKGITGIVGPNGSGKSNIIDAVRWVLGEQSAKTLRGSKMEDIIFNGTAHRKPLGLAEVSLSFDNRDKILPIEYSEVTISRRIYRSGESEYLINGSPCRLKDIKELIMDTGIGIDGYSLIGQGQIDNILSNKPDDRRQLFEEAAGIVKYKTRKLEAEKKLNNTYQNLVRIEDIIKELEHRIEPLKKESDKAKQYIKLFNELKELELNLFLHEIEDINLKLESENKQLNIVKEQLQNYIDEKDKLQKKQENYENKIGIIDKDIQNLKDNYYQINDNIKKLESDKVLYEEKIQNIVSNSKRVNNEINKLKIKTESLHNELKKLKQIENEITNEIHKKEEYLMLQNEKYENINKTLSKDQVKIEDYKSEIIEILNSISSIKSELNSIITIKENINKRIDKIHKERSNYTEKENQLKSEMKKIEHIVSNNKKEIANKTKNKENIIKEYNSLNNENNQLISQYQKEQNLLRDMKSQKKLLEAMQQSYEGFNSSVRKTLEACKTDKNLGKGIHGVVAELFDLPKGLEIALEVSLGFSAQHIVCDNEENAKKVIKYLKKNNLGRVTFLPLSNIKTFNNNNFINDRISNNGIIGIASQLITFSDKYKKLFKYLLGRTLIVDNIDNATKIFKTVNNFKIVTLEGDILNPSGSITGGSYKQKTSNIFSRRRKIIELREKIEKSIVLTKKFETTIENNKLKMHSLNNKLQEIDLCINELNIQLLKEEGNINNVKNQINSIVSSKIELQEELEQLKNDIKDLESTYHEKNRKIKSFENKHMSIKSAISEEVKTINDSQKQLDNLKETIVSTKVNLASLNEKKENNYSEILRINNLVELYKKDIDTKINEFNDYEKDKDNLIDGLNKIKVKTTDQKVLLKQIEYNVNKSTESRKALLEEFKDINNKINILSNNISELKDSLHKIEVKKTRYEMQHDSLIKKIWEKYELSYVEAKEYKHEIIDHNIVSKHIKSLKQKIKDLGEINTSTIKEYDEVNNRYTFICSQKNDLIKAKDSLNKVIKELEQTMREQFLKYFSEINTNFKEIFHKLFNGGKAELILQDDTDVLNSDIEIIAQPPGKKLQNLNLLSGGEKALSAIALLFSILRTKPTPFCILDEIEAALDDANIFRFADFLREFSKSSQFIIITHRKGTMEIIDYLYGVTMQEYGVSKIVSVKLSERAS